MSVSTGLELTESYTMSQLWRQLTYLASNVKVDKQGEKEAEKGRGMSDIGDVRDDTSEML